MSKAFTREDDEAPERPVTQRLRTASPAGVRRNLTPDGAQRFQEELQQLQETASSPPLAPEQLSRIEALHAMLGSATVVPAPPMPQDQVRFGAVVLVEGLGGAAPTEFRIVGFDEVDADRNWIQAQSPLAKALLGTRVGQSVDVALPGGRKTLQVVAIHYKPAP